MLAAPQRVFNYSIEITGAVHNTLHLFILSAHENKHYTATREGVLQRNGGWQALVALLPPDYYTTLVGLFPKQS